MWGSHTLWKMVEVLLEEQMTRTFLNATTWSWDFIITFRSASPEVHFKMLTWCRHQPYLAAAARHTARAIVPHQFFVSQHLMHASAVPVNYSKSHICSNTVTLLDLRQHHIIIWWETTAIGIATGDPQTWLLWLCCNCYQYEHHHGVV